MNKDEYVFFLVDSPKLSGVKNEVIPFAKCVYNKNGDFKMMPVKGFNKIKEGLSILNRLPLEFNFMKDDRLLPAILRNRLLNKKRPEYNEFMDRMGIDLEEGIEKDIQVLFQTMGEKVTDSTVIYPQPFKRNDKEYILNFFLDCAWCCENDLKENIFLRAVDKNHGTIPGGFQVVKVFYDQLEKGVVSDKHLGWTPQYFVDCFGEDFDFNLNISLKKYTRLDDTSKFKYSNFKILLEAKIHVDEELIFYQGEDYEVID